MKKASVILFGGTLLGVVGLASLSVLDRETGASFDRSQQASVEQAATPPFVEHVNTPEAVRAVYMSQCASASNELKTHLLKLVEDTELNSIVVDIKDFSGTVVFPSEVALSGGEGCKNNDFRALIKDMHARGIYVIGRVTVFQDPLYTQAHPDQAVKRKSATTTPWRDYKGLSFVEVGARPFWDYIIGISKEAHALGVDEINFDYIRFPSDGNMSDVHYTLSPGNKADELEKFFRYLSQHMRVEEGGHTPMLSADLFGMVTTNHDDLWIGQVLERALPYFDYIAPMVYPSHYPPGFNGYANPNLNVYGVIKYSLDRAVPRVVATTTPVFSYAHERIGTSTPAVYTKKSYPAVALRPWLQDFDYGGNYGAEEVRAQIQATYDSGLNSWMLWDPANRYTKDALLPAD